MTRRLVVLMAALVAGSALSAQQVRRDSANEPARGTSGIAGTVTDHVSGEPVRGALVTLGADEPGARRTTYTTATGLFTFPELPGGRYTLTITKPGYVRAAYGAKRHDRPGTPINLAPGQTMTDLTVPIAKGGVITGRIVDQHGLPAAGVQVNVLEFRNVLGDRQLGRASGMGLGSLLGEGTDDRGIYRLYGLPPGEYAIMASPRRGRDDQEIQAMTDQEIRAALAAAQQPAGAATAGATSASGGAPASRPAGETVGFAPVFYPGATDASAATAIALGAGEVRDGIDMQLQLVRTARIEGSVIPPADVPPQSVQLMLTAQNQPTGGVLLLGNSMLNSARPDAEGRFSYRAVAPGRYTLTARAVQAGPGETRQQTRRMTVFQTSGDGPPVVMGDGGPQPPVFWAQTDVTVTGDNLDNVVLSLQPAMTITGRIAFEGHASAPQDLTRARMSLAPMPTAGLNISMGFPSTTIAPDGTFTITNVIPGEYRIAGTVPTPRESFTPVNWQMKSAIVNGRDILDFPLQVQPNQSLSDAVITFTDITQQVSGTLQDASGRPAPDYTIVVFPAETEYWLPRARRIRTTRPGTDGSFSVENLPAGNYRMAAVVDMAQDDAWDPAFLEQLVAASYAFSLAAGEQKVQDLRISGGGH